MNVNKNERKIIVGIDPDSKKSGVALIYMPERKISVSKMDFLEIMDLFQTLQNAAQGGYDRVRVIVEGGWLNSSNWHTFGKFMTASVVAEIGRRTGMNHQTGILIAEMCKKHHLECSVVKPLRKYWSGDNGKITQKEAESFMGKLPRMNQDQRDALLLAWTYAGLPVIVKPMNQTAKRR